MPTLELAVTLKQDGVMLPNFPLVRRVQNLESEVLNFIQPTGVSFVSIPGLPLSAGMALNLLVLTADQVVALHTNGQTVGDAGIVLNAGGMLILIDANLAAAPLVALQNNSGTPTTIRGLAAGT